MDGGAVGERGTGKRIGRGRSLSFCFVPLKGPKDPSKWLYSDTQKFDSWIHLRGVFCPSVSGWLTV